MTRGLADWLLASYSGCKVAWVKDLRRGAMVFTTDPRAKEWLTARVDYRAHVEQSFIYSQLQPNRCFAINMLPIAATPLLALNRQHGFYKLLFRGKLLPFDYVLDWERRHRFDVLVEAIGALSLPEIREAQKKILQECVYEGLLTLAEAKKMEFTDRDFIETTQA